MLVWLRIIKKISPPCVIWWRDLPKIQNIGVTPLAGVWVEIRLWFWYGNFHRSHARRGRVSRNAKYGGCGISGHVTPLAGVWVEMPSSVNTLPSCPVTPPCGPVSRNYGCGLHRQEVLVTPQAGVWVEISESPEDYQQTLVMSHMGVRVEMQKRTC